MHAFLLEVEAAARDGTTGVRLLVKDAERGTLIPAFYPFSPYFYLVPTSQSNEGVAQAAEQAAAAQAWVRTEKVTVKNVEVVERRVLGEDKRVLKVYAHSPSHVPKLQEAVAHLGDTYEYGIPFTRRYLIDSHLLASSWVDITWADESKRLVASIKNTSDALVSTPPPLRTLSFDIETYNPSGLPDAKRDPCLMISYASNGDAPEQGVIAYAKDAASLPFVTHVRDEKHMLSQFTTLLKEKNIDVLYGYNSDEFDVPYLVERASALRTPFNPTRKKNGKVLLRKVGLRRRAQVAGRVHLDAFPAAAFIDFTGVLKFPRLTLGAVYHTLTGDEKLDTKKLDIWKAYDAGGEQLRHLLEYSLADAIACRRVMDFILPLEIALSRATCMTLFDVTRATAGQMVESLLMRRAFERGELVPNKPAYAAVQARSENPIEGAYVKMPSPGLYEQIAVFDFRSLYPSIIVSHNIDPSTLNCTCCGKEGGTLAPTGVWFCKKQKGLVPDTLANVLDERSHLKDALKTMEKKTPAYQAIDARQWALKIIANSMYGYLVYPRSRYYSRDCGSAITAFARYYIQQTIERAEKEGFKVLYSDSVTGERCIPYLDAKGILHVEPMEDIFTRFERTIIPSGEKQIIPAPPIRVLTMDPHTREPKWGVVRELIRHKNTKRIFRVRQKTGETRVTEDHSVMVIDGDGRLVESRPQDVGTRPLVHLRTIPEVREFDAIDLLDWLQGYSHTHAYKGRMKTAAFHATQERISFGWTQRSQPITLQRSYVVGSQELMSLCKMLGAYIAEGSSCTPETTRSRWRASIAGSREWLASLAEDYQRVFKGAKISLIQSTRAPRHLTYTDRSGLSHTTVYENETHKIQMMNQLSAAVFKQLCGQKSTGKHLPAFIFHLPRTYKIALLMEMIRGDGSQAWGDTRYTPDYVTSNFRYDTQSLQLASGLCILLAQIGQHYSIRYDAAKKCYTIATCTKNNMRLETHLTEEAYEGFVYDIGVEDTHLFVDACGNLVLHNTDSIFLLYGGDKNRALAFQKSINSELPGRMELELEDFYPRGIFVSKKQEEKGAKKKYALVNETGTIKIRGFELVRRDWSAIARNTQRKVLDILLKEGDLQKALRLVREVITQLREGNVPIADCAIRTQLRKSAAKYEVMSPELSAVQKARAAGLRVQEHALVEYVITKQGKTISDKSQILELAKDYDPDYYINHQVLPAVLKIVSTLGVAEDDLKMQGMQQGLSTWG